MLVCVCLIVSNYSVHKKPKHSGHHEIHLACTSISCTLIADCVVWICNRNVLSNVKMIQARKGRDSKHAVNFSYYVVSTDLNILSISGTPVFKTVPNIQVTKISKFIRDVFMIQIRSPKFMLRACHGGSERYIYFTFSACFFYFSTQSVTLFCILFASSQTSLTIFREHGVK